MRFITGIGQRWKRALGASFTIALLLAVAVVGITLFSSEVLAAWKSKGNAEQTLTSDSAFAGLLDFEAPAATVERFQTDTKEVAKAQTSSNPMLAKNWKFTQNSLLESIVNLYSEGIELQRFSILLLQFFPQSPLTAFAFTFTNAFLQTADGLLTGVLHLPPIPTISPYF